METILKKVDDSGESQKFLSEDSTDEVDTKTTISIMDLCEATSIKKDDIITTLQVIIHKKIVLWLSFCLGEWNVCLCPWRECDSTN